MYKSASAAIPPSINPLQHYAIRVKKALLNKKLPVSHTIGTLTHLGGNEAVLVQRSTFFLHCSSTQSSSLVVNSLFTPASNVQNTEKFNTVYHTILFTTVNIIMQLANGGYPLIKS